MHRHDTKNNSAVVTYESEAMATIINTPLTDHEAHCHALSSRILELLAKLGAQPFNKSKLHTEIECGLMGSIDDIVKSLKTREGYTLNTILDDRSVERWFESTGLLLYWTQVRDSSGKPILTEEES